MTTTGSFTDAAHEEAREQFPDPLYRTAWSEAEVRAKRALWESGAVWARDHLAAQEPTDAECLAVLNVALVPLGEPPKRNGLADWNPAAVERVRAALSAARAARRDETGDRA